jgi:hypothetical protein
MLGIRDLSLAALTGLQPRTCDATTHGRSLLPLPLSFSPARPNRRMIINADLNVITNGAKNK